MGAERNSFGAGHVIASSGSNNMGSDLYSKMISVQAARGFSIQAVVNNNSGSPVGTIYYQGSNNGSTWVNLNAGTAVAGDVDDINDFPDTNVAWLRIFWDRTSGTGLLDCYVHINRMR